jgi:hypothetical protein
MCSRFENSVWPEVVRTVRGQENGCYYTTQVELIRSWRVAAPGSSRRAEAPNPRVVRRRSTSRPRKRKQRADFACQPGYGYLRGVERGGRGKIVCGGGKRRTLGWKKREECGPAMRLI